MTLATRMAVMRDGVIEQIGAPLEIFERPETTFVAQFVGTPSMNLWPAGLLRDGTGPRIRTADFEFTLSPSASIGGSTAGSNIVAGVRPHDIEITSPGGGDVDGVVELIEALGAWTTIHVRVAEARELVRVAALTGPIARAGDRVGLALRRDRVQLFDAATGRNLQSVV